MCEEAPEPRSYGARTRQKQRFVAGVVSPAQPHYLYGLLDANTDLPLGHTPPILAVAASATGYKVASLSPGPVLLGSPSGLEGLTGLEYYSSSSEFVRLREGLAKHCVCGKSCTNHRLEVPVWRLSPSLLQIQ